VTSAMQIQYDGRVFNIEAVFDPTEMKRFLIIFCYERDGR
jgi:SPP1 family predicted phage head-tail adaptor